MIEQTKDISDLHIELVNTYINNHVEQLACHVNLALLKESIVIDIETID